MDYVCTHMLTVTNSQGALGTSSPMSPSSLPAGLDNILHALEREHSKYEHITYYPVAVAANDAAGLAFVGVAWEYKALEGESKDR